MIKRKICSVEGCNLFVWKEGLCQRHLPSSHFQSSSEKKGNTLKKFSEAGKKKREEKVAKTKELHEFMFKWWSSLPEERRLRCWSCGTRLSKEFSTGYIDHLLPKSRYPEFAMDTRNFFVTCLQHHDEKERGFPTEKHREAIENAKKTLIFENN